MLRFLVFLLTIIPVCSLFSKVHLGVDCFFEENHHLELKNKMVGLITNQTGVSRKLKPTYELFLENQKEYKVKAFFSPEHGFLGSAHAFEKVDDAKIKGIPIYSLHGDTRRPTEKMLEGMDVIVYDIQDIGVRPYTYATTLFYVMEEAAKKHIQVIVLDRPNPMGGMIVDGPMLEEKFRSFIGYINVPYCHGMTIGELAQFFNEEYKLNCKLKVVPMKGWNRYMQYKDTGLKWIPPSPHIPEPDTPFYFASTGMLGEIEIVNIGVGYTLPFKVVGADWIDADKFSEALNKQGLPGVHFSPFHYKPFYGSYKGLNCHGVLIIIDDLLAYKPSKVQFALMGILKSLYPEKFKKSLLGVSEAKKRLFYLASGSAKVFSILENEQYATWKLMDIDKQELDLFLKKREKYLRSEYQKN